MIKLLIADIKLNWSRCTLLFPLVVGYFVHVTCCSACSDSAEQETSTPEKKIQNTDIPESKASFVAYRVKNDLRECWSQYVFFTKLKYSFYEAWYFPATIRTKTFSGLSDF